MGATSKLTDILQKHLTDALKAGNTIKASCKAYRLGESTFNRWMADGRPRFVEFREAVEQARGGAEVEAVGLVRLAARKDWRAAAWYLEHSFPETWGRPHKDPGTWGKIPVEVTGPKGGPVQIEGRVLTLDVTKLSEAALESIVSQLEEESDVIEGTATPVTGPALSDPDPGSA